MKYYNSSKSAIKQNEFSLDITQPKSEAQE